MPIIFICNRRSIKQITQKCSEEKIGLFFRRGAVPRGLARRGGKKKKKKEGKKKQGRKRGQTKIPVLFEVRRSTLLSLSALSRSSSPSFQTVLLFSPIAPAKDPLAKSAAFHCASSPSPNVTTNCSFRTPLSLSLHLFFFFEKLDDSNDIGRVDRTFRFERTKRNGKEKKKIWRRRGSLSRERERENVCR